MHLGNMLLLDGRVVVFDGIEFNDDLRWIDVLSEVAFAVMDLEDRGRPDFARRLLNAYLERTGDHAGAAVLPFYLAYRAMVRAKVASIRSRQADVKGEERARLAAECRGYLDLADRYSRPGRPILVVTHGLSGSGKTSVSQRVLEATGAIRVRADVERKRLFGLGPLDRGDDSLYAPEATERTYSRLAEAAEAIIRAGFPAIVDATFLSRARRDTFRRLAAQLGVAFVTLDVQAEESMLRERVARRARESGDASDADIRVLEGQLRTREPLGADERRDAVPVESDRPETIEAAVALIETRRADRPA
jgi:predicted kinase